MLHAKIQDHETSYSRAEDFQMSSPIMGVAVILVMRPGPFI